MMAPAYTSTCIMPMNCASSITYSVPKFEPFEASNAEVPPTASVCLTPGTSRAIRSRLRITDAVRSTAAESGSRAWGFASPDSDYDVRFIYVNRLPWYLTVEPGRDVIEQPISGELDINGWDLRKTLQLLKESNPTLLEWLRSPIVYQQDAHSNALGVWDCRSWVGGHQTVSVCGFPGPWTVERRIRPCSPARRQGGRTFCGVPGDHCRGSIQGCK